MKNTLTTTTAAQYAGITISDTLLGDSLSGGNSTEGLDIDASYARYVELVTEAVQAALPGIEIEISVDMNSCGHSSGPRVLYDFNREDVDDETIVAIYGQIAERVFCDAAWYVVAAEPEVTAQNHIAINYSQARVMWENGEFSEWVEQNGGWPFFVGDKPVSRDDAEDALSDDAWDA